MKNDFTNTNDDFFHPLARKMECATLFYLPPVMCMMLIFYLSSGTWESISLPRWKVPSDKVVHAVMYGGLCYLWIRAFRLGGLRSISAVGLLTAALIAAIYGLTDEYHQSFIPGRSSSVGDIVADAAGASTVAVLVGVGQYRRRRRLRT